MLAKDHLLHQTLHHYCLCPWRTPELSHLQCYFLPLSLAARAPRGTRGPDARWTSITASATPAHHTASAWTSGTTSPAAVPPGSGERSARSRRTGAPPSRAQTEPPVWIRSVAIGASAPPDTKVRRPNVEASKLLDLEEF